jgi:hypothetical protein
MALVVESTSSGVNGSTDSHTLDLPADVASGNLLLMQFGYHDSATVTWPEGWTEITAKEIGGNGNHSIAFHRADGTEGATITVGTSVATQSTFLGYRITGHHATSDPEGASDDSSLGGNSNTPDGPSLAPTWLSGGAEDVLWITFFAMDGNRTVTAYPTNYTDGFAVTQAGGSANCAGTARRELSATSEDPDPFEVSAADAWTSGTVGIRPAAAGGGGGTILPHMMHYVG